MVLLAVAVLLAAVFAWAGAAKLAARSDTTRSFRALDLPAAGALATGVPVLELALAAGLVVVPAVAAPATVAALVAFSVVLLRARRAGVTVGCGCFGTARRGPVSNRDLVRNAALGLAAIAVATGAGVPGPALVAGALGGAAGLAITVRRPSRVGRPAPLVPGLDYGVADTTVVAYLAPGCEGCAAARRAVKGLGPAVQVRIVDLDDGTSPLFAAAGVRTPPLVLTVDRRGRVVDDGPAPSGRMRRWPSRSTSRSPTRSTTAS